MDDFTPLVSLDELNQLASRCVHCGFCNATCPTYLATGLELEAPRGRIALIRSMRDQQPVTNKTRQHLDHCLTCLACETTCPSGVEYRHIIDGGRQWLDVKHPRSLPSRLPRLLLTRAMNYPRWLSLGFSLARGLRFLLPRRLSAYLKIPRQRPKADSSLTGGRGKVIILTGCVQRQLAPAIDDALERILGVLGYQAIRVSQADCCGALGYHLGEVQSARAQAKKTLKVLEPYLDHPENPNPLILMSSSACGLMLKDYKRLFRDDPRWEATATRVQPWLLDPLELLDWHVDELRQHLSVSATGEIHLRIHEPCTLQHGLRLRGRLPMLFRELGFNVAEGPSIQKCCGAGGIQPLLSPAPAKTLRAQKREELGLENVETAIALTSNIGCMLHLDEKGDMYHWLEFLALNLKKSSSFFVPGQVDI